MLELAILGLLKEQDLHGYELKKRLSDMLGLGSGVSFGSLYPALNRLEKAGAVRAVDEHDAAPGIPGTGSLSGELAAFRARGSGSRPRGRKVYGMTERGDALFEELLATRSSPSDDERSFNLRLAFARYLSPDARIGMLERRRAYLLERLARTTGAVRNGWERLDAYTRSLLEHGNETAERDISWLDRLIARERASAGRPAGDAPPSRHSGGPATGTGGGDAPTPANPGSHRSGRGPRRVRKPRDWAASTAPTMPARPAHTQGGMTNP